MPCCQWQTWYRTGLSCFPVFHSKLAVELGLESRSPNLGDFSISSDHVRLSSFFHKILLTWHMPSVFFYNRCSEGAPDGLFPSPSHPLTPESQIMSEMTLTATFPRGSLLLLLILFCVWLSFSTLKKTQFVVFLFLLRWCVFPESLICHLCSCYSQSWISREESIVLAVWWSLVSKTLALTTHHDSSWL